MPLRIDKFLWCVRLTKTRSLATALVAKNKVMCNQIAVKASKEVKVGDLISIQRSNAWFSYKVIVLTDKRVGAPMVATFITDVTPEEERKKLSDYLASQRAYQQFGTGKPTKKDRRHIASFLDEDMNSTSDF